MTPMPLAIAAAADKAIVWENDRLYLLDQRVLPAEEVYLEYHGAEDAAEGIRSMVVRGAPAIGITAAFGVVLGARRAWASAGHGWKAALEPGLGALAASRPTAVNLFWAIARMRKVIAGMADDGDPTPRLLREAQAIHAEDVAANRAMGELGAALLGERTRVITHCNAGALATGGYGTALGVIRSAWAAGKLEGVLADETRPWMQGARLTAWELAKDAIPVTLLTDGAAASRLALGDVGWMIVGSDRIAANGDVANKIGTYSLAVNAKYHGVKVMVAAPTSTIDMQLASGKEIPIETRGAEEVLCCGGTRLGAQGAEVWNPVFDVTPAALVDAIVTEKGVVENPTAEKMAELMGR